MEVRTVIRAFLARGFERAMGGAWSLIMWPWLTIWQSLGRQKLVKGLSGVSSVKINKSSLVRLQCPNCRKSSDFSVDRLEGNPKCPHCKRTFDGDPFVQNLNEQLLAVVQRI